MISTLRKQKTDDKDYVLITAYYIEIDEHLRVPHVHVESICSPVLLSRDMLTENGLSVREFAPFEFSKRCS